MKMKSFECPKFMRNYEKKLGTSDTLSMSCLSHRLRKPGYYIVDCRIYTLKARTFCKLNPLNPLRFKLSPEKLTQTIQPFNPLI